MRSKYTQKSFTHRRFYTQKRFTHAQTVLHTDASTHRSLYTQTLLHTDAFTHRRFLHAQKLLHTDSFYTQTLLHADAFYRHAHTLSHHKRFYTQTRWRHKRPFRTTQTLLHADAFYTRTHRNFTHKRFWRHRRPFRTTQGYDLYRNVKRPSQFFLSFWRPTSISCERVTIDQVKIAIFPQFLTSNVHFVRKGYDWPSQNRYFSSVFDVQRPFRA